MSAEKPLRADTQNKAWNTSRRKHWRAFAGAVIFLGTVLTLFPGLDLWVVLLFALGWFGVFGYTLYFFPEYLRWRLWPFAVLSWPFIFGAAIAIPIHNAILLLICSPLALGLLSVADGLQRWKSRPHAKR